MSQARVCYYTNEGFWDTDREMYVIAKVTEDEAGYDEAATYLNLVEALETTERMNKIVGVSRDDVLDIVASSMRQGKVQR